MKERNENRDSSRYTLDDILEEARLYKEKHGYSSAYGSSGKAEETPSRHWTMEEINRLIDFGRSDAAEEEKKPQPEQKEAEPSEKKTEQKIKIEHAEKKPVQEVKKPEAKEKAEGIYKTIENKITENVKESEKKEKPKDEDIHKETKSKKETEKVPAYAGPSEKPADKKADNVLTSHESINVPKSRMSEFKIQDTTRIDEKVFESVARNKSVTADILKPSEKNIHSPVQKTEKQSPRREREIHNNTEKNIRPAEIKTAETDEKNAQPKEYPRVRNIHPPVTESEPDGEGIRAFPKRAPQTHYIKKIPIEEIEKEKVTAAAFPIEGNFETIERPGIRKKKSKFDATADLEPIPTIVPAEEEDADISLAHKTSPTKIAENRVKDENIEIKERKKEKDDDIVEGQIRLSGFEEAEPEKIDEEVVSEQLLEMRKKKVKQFRLANGDEENDEADIQDDFDEQEEITMEEAENEDNDRPENVGNEIEEEAEVREYIKKEDTPSIRESLKARKAKLTARVFALSAIELILIGIEAISMMTGSDKFSIFGGDAGMYLGVNAALCIVAGIICHSTVVGGLFGLFRGKADADTAVSLALIAAVVHEFVMFMFTPDVGSKIHIYSAVAVFTLLMNALGKRAMVSRILSSFNFCTDDSQKYSVERVRDDEYAFELGHGVIIGEPDIRYSVRTKMPSRFLELSYSNDPADKLCGKVTPIGLFAAIVVAAATVFVTHDFSQALTSLAALLCICVPAASLLASNYSLLKTEKKLIENGAMISGYAAVDEYAQTNAIMLDASDLFPKDSCMLYGIKTFNGMRIDEAILDTGAIIIDSGGPLADVFDKVIEGRREILPPVEANAYEDRMGLSAWIHGRRILVGTRELLIQHGIEVQDREAELQYLHDGRKLIYLAVAGQLSAMFVVSYSPFAEIAEQLRRLEKKGITILVRTSDPNINELMLEDYFDLPGSVFKVLSSNAARIYKQFSGKILDSSDAFIMHNGGAAPFLRAITAAAKLKTDFSLSAVLQVIGIGLGFASVALLSLVSGLSQVGMLQLLVYEIFWALLGTIVPRLKK